MSCDLRINEMKNYRTKFQQTLSEYGFFKFQNMPISNNPATNVTTRK